MQAMQGRRPHMHLRWAKEEQRVESGRVSRSTVKQALVAHPAVGSSSSRRKWDRCRARSRS